MKKVFLTGGCGFIGSHLVPLLLNEGITVTVFDNLSTGRLANILGSLERPGFRFIEGDLRDPEDLQGVMAGHDLVWHLGANTLIPPGGTDVRLDLDANILGTFHLLEAMRRDGVKDLIFASTAAVYGDEPGVQLSEAFGPLHPISLYGASKLAGEGFISAYSHLFQMNAVIFRFSNVIGGGMGHGVIFDLIQKLKDNPRRLAIWGNGRGQKPYFLVDDCIRGMLAGHHACAHLAPACTTFNLGCATVTSVDRVAEIICEEMGLGDVELFHLGGRHGFPGDVPFVHYDATRMNNFGWRPSLSSDEAVRAAARRILDGKP